MVKIKVEEVLEVKVRSKFEDMQDNHVSFTLYFVKCCPSLMRKQINSIQNVHTIMPAMVEEVSLI